MYKSMTEEAGSSVSSSGEYRVVADKPVKADAEDGQSDGGHLWLRLRRFKPSKSAENSPAKRVATVGFGMTSLQDHVDNSDNDSFCWTCHLDGSLICCDNCPRVYHVKCVGRGSKSANSSYWMCPVCQDLKSAGDWSSVSELHELLLSALELMYIEGYEPFEKPVDVSVEPQYKVMIFQPMDLRQLGKNIKDGVYKSPQQFLHDSQWILHNCVIYNGIASPLTDVAKAMWRVCKREVSEIVLCRDCYRMSMKKTAHWFSKPCAKLHKPVWAKVKGYPFWPAKVLNLNGDKYDVRFFGDHNRAKLAKQFLRNINSAVASPSHSGWASACREMDLYVSNLKKANYKDADLEMFKDPPRRNSTEGRLPIKVERSAENKEGSSQRNSVSNVQRRHSASESPPSGDESNLGRHMMTRRNSRAKIADNEKLMQASVVTTTPKATADRLVVDVDDLTGRLRSDAYSSLKPGREVQHASSSSSLVNGQMYMALAGGTSFTFVAANPGPVDKGDQPKSTDSTETPGTSWLEFQEDDGVSSVQNISNRMNGKGYLSALQAVTGAKPVSVGGDDVNRKDDLICLSDLTGKNLVGQLEQSGHPVGGCDDAIEKSCGILEAEPSDDIDVQICQVVNRKSIDTRSASATTTTSSDLSGSKQSNATDTASRTAGSSELSKLESVLQSWTGRWNEKISENGKNDVTERTRCIERAVKKVLAKPDQRQAQQVDQTHQAQRLLLLTSSRSQPTQSVGTCPSSVTSTVSTQPSPLTSLALTVSQLGQQSSRPSVSQAQLLPVRTTSNQTATVYRVLGTVLPQQSLPPGTVTIRTVSRRPPILPKPGPSTQQSARVQAPSIVLPTRQNQSGITATPVRIQVRQLAPSGQQQSGVQTNQTQPTVILRPVSMPGQTGGVQAQPMQILNAFQLPQSQTVPISRVATSPHPCTHVRSPLPAPSTRPPRQTSRNAPTRLLSPRVSQQHHQRSLVFPESSARPTAPVRVNSSSSSHQGYQNVAASSQCPQTDLGAPQFSGSLFAALHDAMLADDQNQAVQRENVTAGVDRIMFSVWRQVEEMVMTLQRDTEQHYKKMLKASLAEQRQQLQEEARRAVEETKRKRWCAHCLEEAGLYCCFNTSYCSGNCQQQHWPSHIQYCRNSLRKETQSGGFQRSSSEPPAGLDSDVRIVSVSGPIATANAGSFDKGQPTAANQAQLPQLSAVLTGTEEATTSSSLTNSGTQLPVIERVEGADGVVCLETAECLSRADNAS